MQHCSALFAKQMSYQIVSTLVLLSSRLVELEQSRKKVDWTDLILCHLDWPNQYLVQ